MFVSETEKLGNLVFFQKLKNWFLAVTTLGFSVLNHVVKILNITPSLTITHKIL